MDFDDHHVKDISDAAGFAESSSGSVSESESIPRPIPVRKGSSYLDTPLNLNSKQYSLNGSQRGKVLIFNQVEFIDHEKYEERDGTKRDVERLYSTLPRLGFRQEDIIVYEDYSASNIERVAEKLENDKDLIESDCLMVVILTHGEEDDLLMAHDGSYHLYKFLDHFTPSALNSMAGKPKIFIIQACRGGKLDRGVQLRRKLLVTDSVQDRVDSQSEIFTYPDFADFLIVMSSHHGHKSFRNEKGSWLIQELCNVIESCDLKSSSIIDILIETNNAVSKRISNADGIHDKKKQISSFYTTFTKQLYFTPSGNR
ncbi:caspase-7-like [Wyeomyia smithii]|uniref:caspase-7-like n=1 Tax=Wyeomyia smithii TaxID=174621 RepID=UPI002467EAFB|nr:caspase-7-like [Wyeomyia smithii]